MLRIRMIELRLIRPGVNREQEVALLHLLAFLEMNLIEIPADARTHFNGLRRFEPPDILVPLNHIARDRLNDGNSGRRSGGRGMLSAAREQESDQKRRYAG
jgi:hypothetical protein